MKSSNSKVFLRNSCFYHDTIRNDQDKRTEMEILEVILPGITKHCAKHIVRRNLRSKGTSIQSSNFKDVTICCDINSTHLSRTNEQINPICDSNLPNTNNVATSLDILNFLPGDKCCNSDCSNNVHHHECKRETATTASYNNNNNNNNNTQSRWVNYNFKQSEFSFYNAKLPGPVFFHAHLLVNSIDNKCQKHQNIWIYTSPHCLVRRIYQSLGLMHVLHTLDPTTFSNQKAAKSILEKALRKERPCFSAPVHAFLPLGGSPVLNRKDQKTGITMMNSSSTTTTTTCSSPIVPHKWVRHNTIAHQRVPNTINISNFRSHPQQRMHAATFVPELSKQDFDLLLNKDVFDSFIQPYLSPNHNSHRESSPIQHGNVAPCATPPTSTTTPTTFTEQPNSPMATISDDTLSSFGSFESHGPLVHSVSMESISASSSSPCLSELCHSTNNYHDTPMEYSDGFVTSPPLSPTNSYPWSNNEQWPLVIARASSKPTRVSLSHQRKSRNMPRPY